MGWRRVITGAGAGLGAARAGAPGAPSTPTTIDRVRRTGISTVAVPATIKAAHGARTAITTRSVADSGSTIMGHAAGAEEGAAPWCPVDGAAVVTGSAAGCDRTGAGVGTTILALAGPGMVATTGSRDIVDHIPRITGAGDRATDTIHRWRYAIGRATDIIDRIAVTTAPAITGAGADG